MKRRNFLKNITALTVPMSLGLPGTSPLWALDLANNSDKIIVLIQLIGGCDGLSSFIPLDQFGNLYNVRSNILPKEDALLKAGDKNAFHPALRGFHNLYSQGKLSVVQNVGYPLQNRSHFRSSDIWNTGSSSQDYLDTGWLGRYIDSMDSLSDDYPQAVSIGRTVSETCQGTATNHSVALSNPLNPVTLPYGIPDIGDSSYFDTNMQYILDTIYANNTFGSLFESTYHAGRTLSDKYPENNPLAESLQKIAVLISGGLKTPVYTVALGGFDTHSSQVDSQDPAEGILPDLLRTLGDAMEAFWDDLELLGFENKVMALTYSEFGRKIRSNASFGTDHGDAAPMYIFGSCLQNSIIGNNPVIDTGVSQSDGVPYEFDFRNVYGALIEDWFSLGSSRTASLFPNFTYANPGIIDKNCSSPILSGVTSRKDKFSSTLFPQPARDVLKVKINNINSHRIAASILSNQGKILYSKEFPCSHSGESLLTLDVRSLPEGVYYLELIAEDRRSVQKVIIQ